MKSEQNLFPLKMLVISMGLLLLGGTVFLFSVLFAHAAQGGCKDATLDLSGRGAITGFAAEGKNVRILISKDKNTFEMVTADPCSGKLLGTFTVRYGEAAPAAEGR